MIAPQRVAQTDDFDTDLMIRVRHDDVDAFVELYQRHYQRVVRTVSRMLNRETFAEDIAQQVFMQAYRARSRYVPTAKFTTWLGTITRNVVFNHRRTLSRRPEPITPSQSGAEYHWLSDLCESGEAEPSCQFEQSESRRRVRAAVSNLQGRQQTAVELVYMRGYSHRQAADAMESTVPSIKQLLHRGRTKLMSDLRTADVADSAHMNDSAGRKSMVK